MDNLMLYYNLDHTDFELEIGQKLRKDLELPFSPYVVRGSDSLMKKVGMDFMEGNTVTTVGFYAPQGKQLRINIKNPKFLDQITYFNHNGFWLTNFEMETSTLYAMARLLGIKP